jgi:hypothetical protein
VLNYFENNHVNGELPLFKNVISDIFVGLILLFLLFLYTATKLFTRDTKFEVTVLCDMTSSLYNYTQNSIIMTNSLSRRVKFTTVINY